MVSLALGAWQHWVSALERLGRYQHLGGVAFPGLALGRRWRSPSPIPAARVRPAWTRNWTTQRSTAMPHLTTTPMLRRMLTTALPHSIMMTPQDTTTATPQTTIMAMSQTIIMARPDTTGTDVRQCIRASPSGTHPRTAPDFLSDRALGSMQAFRVLTSYFASQAGRFDTLFQVVGFSLTTPNQQINLANLFPAKATEIKRETQATGYCSALSFVPRRITNHHEMKLVKHA